MKKRLSRNRDVGKLVADKTGLTGGFNFELDWMPERLESSSDDRMSIFTALAGAARPQIGIREGSDTGNRCRSCGEAGG
jgi:uncharacterized protein (TIGR03435 family)